MAAPRPKCCRRSSTARAASRRTTWSRNTGRARTPDRSPAGRSPIPPGSRSRAPIRCGATCCTTAGCRAPATEDREARIGDRRRRRLPRQPQTVWARRAFPPPAKNSASPAGGGGLEIIFRPDPTIWDGRFANNGWLQELPKPLTQITWNRAAWISQTLAEQKGLKDGDLIELRYKGNTAKLPVAIVPGQPDQSV